MIIGYLDPWGNNEAPPLTRDLHHSEITWFSPNKP